MNTSSIDCKKVEFNQPPFKEPPFKGMSQPGDFCFSPDFKYIYIWLPGVSGPDALKIARTSTNEPRVWAWNGNEEKPTLTPSINAPGQWHGFMIDGRLISC